MKITSFHPMVTLVTGVGLAAFAVSTLSVAASSLGAEKKLPRFAKVQEVVATQLASLRDYEKSDIISSSDMKPVFPELAKMGWKVKDQEEILKQMLRPTDFLVKELRTPNGKRFMRKISGDQAVYDRLDRVSEHKRGPATIRNVIRLPDGEKYMRAKPAPGNPTLSDLVLMYDRGSVQHRSIKDFDKPTGKIYTGNEFLKRLKESYAEANRPKRPKPR